MRISEELVTQFDMLHEMFNKENDPEEKAVYKERLLELAYIIGKMAQDQATEDQHKDR
jgi:hypothetical protein